MFNKKTFCNSRFRWVLIAIGITAACASSNQHTEAATINTTMEKGINYEYQLK